MEINPTAPLPSLSAVGDAGKSRWLLPLVAVSLPPSSAYPNLLQHQQAGRRLVLSLGFDPCPVCVWMELRLYFRCTVLAGLGGNSRRCLQSSDSFSSP